MKQIALDKLVLENNPAGLPRCGLYLNRAGPDYSLPLSLLDVEVYIHHSLVDVQQRLVYQNPCSDYIDAVYCFPIDPSAALHRFEVAMDGQVVRGLVKEKEAARKEFAEKKAEGATVALAEVLPESKDVLTIKVGNLPPGKQIQVSLAYLTECEVEINKFWAVTLSSRLRPRYASVSSAPKELGTAPSYKWLIKFEVEAASPILFSKSPTHSLQLLQRTDRTATWVLPQSEKPERDLRFVYCCEEMDRPRLLASKDGLHGVLTFVPQFCLLGEEEAYDARKAWESDVGNRGQFIFLIDRSGSMAGRLMDRAKEALVLFLKSLPTKSYFNVVSFGSGFKPMFEKSVAYGKESLANAIAQVQAMSADMGGTQLLSAIRSLLRQDLIPGQPKNLLVLTDGGVENVETVLGEVQAFRQVCRSSCVGIGSGASRALVRGIAERGQGEYSLLDLEDDLNSKVIEILLNLASPALESLKFCFDDALFAEVLPLPQSMPFLAKNRPVNFYCKFRRTPSDDDRVSISFFNSFLGKEQTHELSLAPLLRSDSVKPVFALRKIRYLENQLRGSGPKMALHGLEGQDLRKQVIEESVGAQVLSEYTSWLAVDQRDQLKIQYQDWLAKKQATQLDEIQKIARQQVLRQHSIGSMLQPQQQMARTQLRGQHLQRLSLQSQQLDMSSMQFNKKSQPGFFSSAISSIKGLFSGPPSRAPPVPQVRAIQPPQINHIAFPPAPSFPQLNLSGGKQMMQSTSVVPSSCSTSSMMPPPPPSLSPHFPPPPPVNYKMQQQNCRPPDLDFCQMKSFEAEDCFGFLQEEQREQPIISKKQCLLKKEIEKVKQKQTKPLTDDQMLKKIIQVQEFDGHWQLADDLLRALGLDRPGLESARGKHGLATVLTYLLLGWMERRFGQRLDLKGLIRKGREWLGEQGVRETNADWDRLLK